MKMYLLLLAIVSQISVSFANNRYQSKVCSELPYMLIVVKAAAVLRQSSFAHIQNKYKLSLDPSSQRKMEEEIHKARFSIDSSVCQNRTLTKDLMLMIHYKLRSANKIKRICLSFTTRDVPSYITSEIETLDERDHYTIRSWRDYYESSTKNICINNSRSKYCHDKSEPNFKYSISLNNLDEALLCKEVVHEVNTYLKWLQ